MVYWAQVDSGSRSYIYRAPIDDPNNKRTVWQSTFRIKSIAIDKDSKWIPLAQLLPE